MSDASLAALKTAAKVTGIPASRLLELCVRRGDGAAAEQTEAEGPLI